MVVAWLSLGTLSGDNFDMSQIYPIDVGHSYLGFSIKYMGLAKVRGRFTDYSGTVRYDPADVTKTSATVIVKVASLNTDLEFRDKDLKSANWFDAEKFPVIKFESKRCIRAQTGFELIGDLTIREVTKEVAIHVVYASGVQKDVRGDSQIIFTGSVTIDRKEFGEKGARWSAVKEGITAVASDVEIELSVLGKQLNAPNFKNRVSNAETPQGKIYQKMSMLGLDSGFAEFGRLRAANQKMGPGPLNVVGYMLLLEGKKDEAIRIFERMLKEFPEDTNSYDSLAEAYAASGRKSDAAKFYKMVMQKDSLNANAAEILRHLDTH